MAHSIVIHANHADDVAHDHEHGIKAIAETTVATLKAHGHKVHEAHVHRHHDAHPAGHAHHDITDA
jgi:hypothetical protein